jgi:hypothetical protein
MRHLSPAVGMMGINVTDRPGISIVRPVKPPVHASSAPIVPRKRNSVASTMSSLRPGTGAAAAHQPEVEVERLVGGDVDRRSLVVRNDLVENHLRFDLGDYLNRSCSRTGTGFAAVLLIVTDCASPVASAMSVRKTVANRGHFHRGQLLETRQKINQ